MAYDLRYTMASAFLFQGALGCTNKSSSSPDTCPVKLGTEYEIQQPLCLAKSVSRTNEITDTVDKVVALGAGTIRSDFLWHRIEAEQGQWTFDHHDQVVNSFSEKGIEVIPMLAYGVPWASSQTEDDHYFPPDDPADFANFAAIVAERYKDSIQRFEIWNEPNAGFRFWKPDFGGNPEQFGALVIAAANAIHAVHPEAEVILGGTFYHEQIIPGAESFLEDMLVHHPTLLDTVDSVAIHPYSLYPPTVAPEYSQDGEMPIWEMIQNIQRIVEPLPVTVTEYGITTIGETSREEQADMMERGILLALAEGATDVCWYTIQNGDDPTNFEDNFGLLDHDGSWSPTAETFLSLSQKIDNGNSIARIEDLPDGLWGVQISNVGRAFWGSGTICDVEVDNQVTWFFESE